MDSVRHAEGSVELNRIASGQVKNKIRTKLLQLNTTLPDSIVEGADEHVGQCWSFSLHEGLVSANNLQAGSQERAILHRMAGKVVELRSELWAPRLRLIWMKEARRKIATFGLAMG